MEVVIMRGIPGSGKSWYVNTLKSKGTCVVCSADDYRLNEKGEYNWNPERQGTAHDCCLRKFLGALRTYVPKESSVRLDYLVVDNTNTTAHEVAPYYRLAQVYGIKPRIVRVMCDPRTACARNQHNVPHDKILAMYWQLMQPLPYGWTEEIAWTDPPTTDPIQLARF